MSDRRAKYIILASIIFVGIVGISHGQGLFELTDVKPSASTTSLGYAGHVSIVLQDSDGNIKLYKQQDNTVVRVGRDCAANLVFNAGITPIGVPAFDDCELMIFMAIGSGSAPVDTMDTGLFDKTTNGNILLTIANTSTDPLKTFAAVAGNDATLTVLRTFTILEADSGESIAETGMFDENNNMFARTALFPPIPVTTDDKLTIEWTLQSD